MMTPDEHPEPARDDFLPREEAPVCYYTCTLVPPAFLARSGHRPVRLADTPQARAPEAGRQSHLCHPTTCPYVVRMLAAGDRLLGRAGPGDRLVAPAGCDAARRAADILAVRHPGRVVSFYVPREDTEQAVDMLARDLQRAEDEIGRAAAEADGGEQDLGAAEGVRAAGRHDLESPQDATLEYPAPPRPGGVFVIAGPLSDTSFLRFLDEQGAGVAGLESCTGPLRGDVLGGLGGSGDAPEDIAREILSGGLCPRSVTRLREARLARLFDDADPSAVVYLRQPFCDPGSYDARLAGRLASARNLPFLELEADFPFELSGPLRTRAEALLETISLEDDLLEELL